MGRLEGKTALITGASRGIGRAIALELAREGAKVAINYQNSDAKAQEIADEINKQGGACILAKANLADPKEARGMVKRVAEQLRHLDILVNNAGWDRLMPFLKTTPELWEKIIAVNYKGVIHTCYAVLPHMAERKQGSIVNISSDSARVGSLGEAIYSGAKAAVVAFSKTLAREHARDNIRVNVICPGLADTPLLSEIQQDPFGQKVLGSIVNFVPLKRLAQPDDIAPLVVFLASDAAGYITGQVTSVNGGLTMVG